MRKCASVARRCAPVALLLAVALACGGGLPSVDAGLSNLASWEEFSPPQPAATTQSDIPPAECPGGHIEAGICLQQEMAGDELYACTTTKYSLVDTPGKIVMYSPDVELLWPGALIQGKSHRDGIGALLPVPVKERGAIKVSIPGLATDDNFRVVEHPDQAEVMQAVGSMIANATAIEVASPSTISFDMKTFESEQSFSLKAGMSAKYLGFRASASASVQCDASENTVAVQLYEKMFEVVVEPPEHPADFFSADFTPEMLQEQVDLGRIHATENVPVYVSNVVFGRMMMFSVSSKESLSDIKAALSAAYRGLGFSGSFDLEAKHRKTLSESRISVASMGGDASATEAVITSGDWRQYFTAAAPLTSAAPLSYTFRSISDNSVARVSESASYNIRECKPAGPAASGVILSSFDSWDEGWKSPGGSNPILTFGETDYDSIVNAYIGAHDGEGLVYFTAPIRGFLEFVDRSFYGGTLSFWWRAKAAAATPTLVQADDLILIGRNGVTLSARIAAQRPELKPITGDDSKVHATLWRRVEVPLVNKPLAPPAVQVQWSVGRCFNPDSQCAVSQPTVAQMQEVLDSVVGLSIRGEFFNGEDWGYLDEVELRKPAGG